jgi:hypothetical protein
MMVVNMELMITALGGRAEAFADLDRGVGMR